MDRNEERSERPLRILILEDEPADAEILVREIRRAGIVFQERVVSRREEFIEALGTFRPDVILSDFTLPSFNGFDALELAHHHADGTPFILVTGSVDEETAAEIIKAGASDYVVKERLSRLIPALKGGLERAEERRRRSQAERKRARLAAVLEATSDFVGVAELDGAVTYLNRAGRQMIGLPDEPLSAIRQATDVHPEPTRSRIRDEALPAAIASGLWSGESAVESRSGKIIPVSQVIVALRGADGQVDCVATVMRDLTDLKRVEAELREREAQLRVLLETAPEAVFVLDVTSGRFVEVTGVAERLFDTSREALLASGLIELSPARQPDGRDSSELLAGFVSDALGSGAPSFEWTARRATGEAFACEVRLIRMPSTTRQLVRGSIWELSEKILIERERNRLEREHESLMERLELTFELMPIGCILNDADFRFTYWNPAAERIFGFSREEVVGRLPYGTIVSESVEGQVADVFHRLKSGAGTLIGLVAQNVTKDGRRLVCRWNNKALRDPEGRFLGIMSMVEDVTEAGRVEEALSTAAKQQATVAEISRRALSDRDLPSLLTDAVRMVTRTLGVELAAIAELETEGQELVLRAEQGAAPHTADQRFPAGNGSPSGYALLSGGPVVIEDLETEQRFQIGASLRAKMKTGAVVPITIGDAPYGTLAVFAHDRRAFSPDDVHFLESVANTLAAAIEHRRTTDALVSSEERYGLLFEHNMAGVARTSLLGVLLECNRAFAKTFGFESEGELIGRRVQDLYARAGDHAQLIQRLEREKALKNTELEMRDRNGRAVWVIGNFSLVDEDDPPTVEATIIDNTARKRLEDQLRQTQKMEAIGQLAGGVAHDFNNILTAILGYGDVLASRLGGNVPELDEIRKAAERAAALTRQLLTFSHRHAVAVVDVPLNDLVSDLLKMLNRLIGENIEIISDLDPTLRIVRADPRQLEQVVMNLTVNARDAMPAGGRLKIVTHNVELAEQDRHRPGMKPGRWVLLSVSDTGVGMDAATQARVFEPFFTTKEPGKGTGLGLATVYGIVKQAGGHVFVQSEKGRGSTFEMYLPAARARPGSHSVRPGSPLRGEGETILLVEDNDSVRQLLARVLSDLGYVVLSASNGTEALSVAQHHGGIIDLVLSDVVMPDIKGPVVVQRLKESRPDVKVLYMSGYTDGSIGGELGVAEGRLLQKPVTADQLARAIRGELDRS